MRPILVGARVRLRPPDAHDVDFAVRFANDEELRGYLRFYRPIPESEEREWLASLQDHGELVWLTETLDAGEPLGFVSLNVDHVSRHAELGIGILGAANRGRGYGHDIMRVVLDHAFDALGLQRVHLHVLDDNPARRLYEGLGFRVEGTLRRHTYKRGAFHDQRVMGILREEWRS